MGGDGAVTLPQLRAVARRHPDFAVLHFDSHTDTYPIPGYNTATTFTRAAEEGLLDVARSFHVGTRGSSFMPGVLEFGREVGYTIVPFDDFDADGPARWTRSGSASASGRCICASTWTSSTHPARRAFAHRSGAACRQRKGWRCCVSLRG